MYRHISEATAERIMKKGHEKVKKFKQHLFCVTRARVTTHTTPTNGNSRWRGKVSKKMGLPIQAQKRPLGHSKDPTKIPWQIYFANNALKAVEF